MSAVEARAWWAEVEEVRERIEQRRESGASVHLINTERTAARPRRWTTPQPASSITAVTPRALTPVRHAEAGAVRAASQPNRGSSRPIAPRGPARPDLVALWAVLLGILLLFVSVGTAGAATRLGDRTLKAPMEGRDVRHLQGQLKHLGLLQAPATAHFGSLTRGAVKRFQRSRCLTADGIAGPATIQAITRHTPRCPGAAADAGAGRLTRTRVVTWYGPGMYGRSTACGQRLTSTLIGVAHRSLPCGTSVTLSYHGRVVHAAVVDRGPYADGVQYDLTWAAARRLGVLSAGRASVRSDH